MMQIICAHISQLELRHVATPIFKEGKEILPNLVQEKKRKQFGDKLVFAEEIHYMSYPFSYT